MYKIYVKFTNRLSKLKNKLQNKHEEIKILQYLYKKEMFSSN